MPAEQPPNQPELSHLLAARQGHFRLESGHHANLWLDLELLFLYPRRVEPFSRALADRVSALGVDLVCAPLNEGTFVALQVATLLDLPFTYAERFADATSEGLFPVSYRLPGHQRDVVVGKRVAIVNDVVSAGSAVRGTLNDLRVCGAHPVAIASLLTLGDVFPRFAAAEGIPLLTLEALAFDLWTPAGCPLCAAGSPVEEPSET